MPHHPSRLSGPPRHRRGGPRKRDAPRMTRRALLGAAALAPLASACTSAAGSGAEYTMVASHNVNEEHYMHRAFVLFRDRIRELSSGQIDVQIFPNGLLGGERELIEGAQLDNIQLLAPSSSPVAAFQPLMNVWDIPYLFADRQTAYTVLDGPFGQKTQKALEDVRLKGLGYWENGFRNLTLNRTGVRAPEDMAGIKLRTLENATQIRAWNATGASATPMAFPEVYTGLQQGTIDGQENPYALIVSQRFYEVQESLVASQHVYTPSPLIISKRFFDKLPSQLQDAVEQVGRESVEYCRTEAEADESTALQVIVDAGLEIGNLTEEELAAFRNVMRPVAEEYVSSIVPAGTVEELSAIIEEAEA